MKYLSASTALLLMSFAVNAGNPDENKPTLEGPYLGQTPPSLTPKTFAPGIISTEGWEYGVVFAPNMKELYWVREVNADTDPKQEFVVYEQLNNVWHERVISPRSGTPTLSTDGNTMFFGRSYKERIGNNWSDAKRLGPDFEDIRIMRVTASEAGTIAIDEATREGDGMLRYSRIIDGKREAPIPFPKEINTGQWNAHPFIAPDESYIMWDGERESGFGSSDLYISFREKDGSWGEAINLGDTVNTEAEEGGPRITPDGKYLFFNRMVLRTDGSGERQSDLYWIDASFIQNLKPVE